MSQPASSSSVIEYLLKKAIEHHEKDSVSQSLPIDGLAYFKALNLLGQICREKEWHTKVLKGELISLPQQSEVLITPVYESIADEQNYYVLVAKVILIYRVKEGLGTYFFDVFGGHNKLVHPKEDLKNKPASLIIPFDLMAKVNKKAMPIDVLSAIVQNPYHECFKYSLSPSPASSLAINHDLNKQMGFVVHPKLLYQYLDKGNDEQKRSLSYDTKIALELLNSRYNIFINEDMVKKINELDEKVANINGTACIEIETLN